ncbi:MAG: sialate O-acetylesterase [Chthoniobacteraceae bacterium]
MKHPFLISFIIAANGCGWNMPAWADVSLPSIISTHAVLQKSDRTQIYGKAAPGEVVKVSLGGIGAQTVADADGKWKIILDVTSIGEGPFDLVVEGNNRTVISDVILGEVWVCSGQSNMAFRLARDAQAAQAGPQEVNPRLREFCVEEATSETPQDDCKGSWVIASPQTAGRFSAVGYYFGKNLQQALNRPVGLLFAAWPGTSVSAWLPQSAIDESPEWKEKQARLQKLADESPALKNQFLSAYRQWESQFERTDRPTDPGLYALAEIATSDWKPVKLASSLQAAGICGSGAVWLRRQVSIPPSAALKTAMISLGSLRDFNALYINGKKIGETTVESLKNGREIRYIIPNGTLNEGENTLAVRLFTPSENAAFPSSMFLELEGVRRLLNDDWKAKVEFELPGLSDEARKARPTLATIPEPQQIPGGIFNGMVHPLMAATVQGMIWYQGEQDAGRPGGYWPQFESLIRNWRAGWSNELPFYFCQLPNYGAKEEAPGNSLWAQLREAQARALELAHTGQAVLIDLGEQDIHPIYKQKVGERLARIALAQTYKQNLADSGPVFKGMKIEGDKLRLSFLPGEGRLVAKPLPAQYQPTSMSPALKPLVRHSPEGELEGFAICGENKKWAWATAKIDGDTVVVWSRDVPTPVAVRYAWADNPTCNLYNKADLPASPFQAGN